MPRRVIIADRVIIHERVSVPGLRPLRGRGDDAIRRGETSQRGVEPTSVEIINSEAGFFALTGEFVVRAEGVRSVAYLAEGFVESPGIHCSTRVGGDRRAADVIGEQEGQSPAGADGQAILKVKVLKYNCY